MEIERFVMTTTSKSVERKPAAKPKRRERASSDAGTQRQSDRLDEALLETFPASNGFREHRPGQITIRNTVATARKNKETQCPAPSPSTLQPGSKGNSVHAAAEALNGVLADSFALYLKTKNFHWHMSRPAFSRLSPDARRAGRRRSSPSPTTIAERVRKIGGTTLRSIGDIARQPAHQGQRRRFRQRRSDMLAELREDNLRSGRRPSRDPSARATRQGDVATASMLDDWTDEAERRAWFLFEASRGSHPDSAQLRSDARRSHQLDVRLIGRNVAGQAGCALRLSPFARAHSGAVAGH